MSQVPQDPSIFHITHLDNLEGILLAGGLWSDAQRSAQNLTSTNIGHLHIKQPLRWARAVAVPTAGRTATA